LRYVRSKKTCFRGFKLAIRRKKIKNRNPLGQTLKGLSNIKSNNKLDWGKVKEIRTSNLSNSELAEKYNCSKETISSVRSFKTWVEE
jgi:DNA-binding transcriptional regulator YiaG